MSLFPEISRNVSGNFWKSFPAVSRNIFPEISRKVQFEQNVLFKKFLLKANEGPYATTDLMDSFRRPNYLYEHTFREFSCANKNSECVFVRIVWYPDHVPEVSCSVRTFIHFRKKGFGHNISNSEFEM